MFFCVFDTYFIHIHNLRFSCCFCWCFTQNSRHSRDRRALIEQSLDVYVYAKKALREKLCINSSRKLHYFVDTTSTLKVSLGEQKDNAYEWHMHMHTLCTPFGNSFEDSVRERKVTVEHCIANTIALLFSLFNNTHTSEQRTQSVYAHKKRACVFAFLFFLNW